MGWWTPKYIIRRELKNVSNQTTTALKALLPKYAHQEKSTLTKNNNLPTSIEQQRATMAQTQAKLVETLEAAFGHEEAVRLGQGSIVFSWSKTWVNKPAANLASATTQKT